MSAAAQRRAKQTVRNLIFSMVATLGLVVLLVLGVPRDDSNRITEVDYRQIAAEAEASLGFEVITPEVPSDWWSNAARLETDLGVQSWYVGFVTEDNQFIALLHGFEVNPSWTALTLQGNWLEDEVVISGRTWEIWPSLTPTNPPGTKDYAMIHSFANSAVVIYGTADEADFRELAGLISQELEGMLATN
ncbi:MAG: DUF4245 family protein [Aquiluna sp.]